MKSGYVHTLWIIGAGLVLAGLVINQSSGNLVYQILIANGVLSSMTYLAFRGFLTENPRFLAAREKLIVCLWIMVAGAIGISLSTVLTLTFAVNPISSPLFWGGGIAFLVSAWAFIFSLAVSRPKPLRP